MLKCGDQDFLTRRWGNQLVSVLSFAASCEFIGFVSMVSFTVLSMVSFPDYNNSYKVIACTIIELGNMAFSNQF